MFFEPILIQLRLFWSKILTGDKGLKQWYRSWWNDGKQQKGWKIWQWLAYHSKLWNEKVWNLEGRHTNVPTPLPQTGPCNYSWLLVVISISFSELMKLWRVGWRDMRINRFWNRENKAAGRLRFDFTINFLFWQFPQHLHSLYRSSIVYFQTLTKQGPILYSKLKFHVWCLCKMSYVMISALESGWSGVLQSTSGSHCVVFLGKKLCSHSATIHPSCINEYWQFSVRTNWHPIQGGLEIFFVAPCYGNRGTLWQCLTT